jgi:4-carboxymuconolactone decarboxylase
LKATNTLFETDPGFAERFEAFALQEVVNEPEQQLEETPRYLAILAALIGSQSLDEYKLILPCALESALDPVKVKEIVYQAVPYLGIGRAYPFLIATNKVLLALGIELPLDEQSTTTMEDRLEKGAQAQVDIFGPHMKDFWKGGHINRWLAANCFGDYYTRKGLDIKQREMITFCFLFAQGGCESQLASHVMGNIRVGNEKAFLIKIVSQCLPYIGYPRSLNAINCINQANEK